jgi:hypothetical protein
MDGLPTVRTGDQRDIDEEVLLQVIAAENLIPYHTNLPVDTEFRPPSSREPKKAQSEVVQVPVQSTQTSTPNEGFGEVFVWGRGIDGQVRLILCVKR